MLLLKVISRLMDYPTQELFEASDELLALVAQQSLSQSNKVALISFIETLTAQDLYDAQERYDLLFDRGRALSLLLFEHVHGESRDRGQAMVDLMQVYNSKGFELSSEQLPDYLPIFLEFLSEQPTEFAQEWLGDISHLLAMLSARLNERECHYQVLFDTLIELAGVEIDQQEILEAVKKETPDDTVEAIDKAWLDKEIRFDDPMQSPCSTTGLNQPVAGVAMNEVPIKWHDATSTPAGL
jgi:nitrate reductase delta subunit